MRLMPIALLVVLVCAQARALEYVALPLADRVNEADLVVLAKVVDQELASIRYIDDRIRVTVEVVDSMAAATVKKGERLTFLASAPYSDGPFGDWGYATGATYLLLLANVEGRLESILVSSPMEILSAPRNKHPAARGDTWLRLAGWRVTGIVFPRGLPVSLGDEVVPARRCPTPFADNWSAWFTWEDFKRIAWRKVTADDVIASRLLEGAPCASDAHVPQLIECHSCDGQPLDGVNRIRCTRGRGVAVVLKRHGDSFRAEWAGDFAAPRRMRSGSIVVFTSVGRDVAATVPVIFSADDPLGSMGWPARAGTAGTDFSLRLGPPSQLLWFDRNAATLASAFDPKIRLVLPATMAGHLHARIDDTSAYDAEVSCVVE